MHTCFDIGIEDDVFRISAAPNLYACTTRTKHLILKEPLLIVGRVAAYIDLLVIVKLSQCISA